MGVGSLYLAPTMARSPAQLAQPRLRDDAETRAPIPSAPPAKTPDVAAGSGVHPENPAPTRRPASTPATRPVISPAAATEPPPAASSQRPNPRPTGATAFSPGPVHDDQPPEAVASFQPPQVTRETLDLAWSPATDNVGVVGYKIWLNGFPVVTTTKTHATVRWFNDDAVQHAVQIRAIDAVGNQSDTSPTIVVTRPPALPTPAPSLAPSSTTTPTPEPTPTPTAPNKPANDPAPAPPPSSPSTPDVAE